MASDSGDDDELWRSNGTTLGTKMIEEINAAAGAYPTELTRVGTVVFFAADDGSSGRELWKTDGTAAGTVRVKNIHPDVP